MVMGQVWFEICPSQDDDIVELDPSCRWLVFEFVFDPFDKWFGLKLPLTHPKNGNFTVAPRILMQLFSFLPFLPDFL